MTADDSIIDRVLQREGSEVQENAHDRSGRPSRFGITAEALSAHRGHAVTDDEIRKLSVTEARDIYREQFIRDPGFDRIGSEALREVLIDYGVNSGPDRAVRALQRVLGVVVDGKLGPGTLGAAALRDGRRLALGVLAWRLRTLGHLISVDHGQAVFAEGWLNRVAEQIEEVA